MIPIKIFLYLNQQNLFNELDRQLSLFKGGSSAHLCEKCFYEHFFACRWQRELLSAGCKTK